MNVIDTGEGNLHQPGNTEETGCLVPSSLSYTEGSNQYFYGSNPETSILDQRYDIRSGSLDSFT